MKSSVPCLPCCKVSLIVKTFDLREEILKEHSKAQRDKIIAWIGDNQQRFDELFELFLHDDYKVTQRSAWPLSHCVIAHPHFIKKRFGQLINNLSKPGIHDSIKRNTVRILQDMEIPKKYQGQVMDLCFKYVESPTEAVAIKAFALTVLENLARHYPEIIPEIKLLIEEQLPNQTAAFKSRANSFLRSVASS